MVQRKATPPTDTIELLQRLRALGVNLSARDGRLVVDAPQGALPPELREELGRRKPELLEWLSGATEPPEAQAPPLEQVGRDGPPPLAFPQERLWFLSLLEPANTAYNLSSAYRLTGPLDVGALERTLTEIVRRHEALRTRFEEVDGAPVQVILPPESVVLPTVDLSDLPADDREAALAALNAREAGRPLDIAAAPPRRFLLARCGPEEHVLIAILHHIVTDGWSYQVLLHEMSVIYAAFRESRPSPLPELRHQYVDYAAWQRSWLQGEALDRQLAYWKRKLSGGMPALRLPTDRPRPALQTHRGAVQPFAVEAGLTAELKQLGQSRGATLFMTLLAAFQVLLCRYTGQTDFGVGSPIANRSRPELEELIGFFVNTLVLRADLEGDPPFTRVLERVRSTTLEAYQHPDIPFEKLVQELKPPRDLSLSPLFQVMFILQNFPEPETGGSGLQITSLELDPGSAMFDLTVYLWEEAGKLVGSLEYNTDLFDRATVARLADHYKRLLAEIVRNPDRGISRLALLPPGEHRRIVFEWNATAREVPPVEMHELFEQRATRTPDAVAVVHGKRTVAYADLDRDAGCLAAHLQRLGVAAGDLVAVVLERSIEAVTALLAILKAGGAYVPLDPAFPPERVAFMLEDSAVRFIVTDSLQRRGLPPTTARVIELDAEAAAIAQAPGQVAARDRNPEALAYVIYTSGSTGRPKGVQIPHRAVVNFLRSMAVEPGLVRDDVLLSVTTMSFDIFGLELFLPLSTGARVVLVDRADALDGRRLGELIDAHRVSVMQATPSTWRLLLDAGWAGRRSLRMFIGGEALPRDLVAPLLERGAELWNLYGPTETTIWSTVHRIRSAQEPVLIGRPIANTRTHILDETLQPVPVGVAGELYIGGLGLAHGYLNRRELTAEKFIPDPFRTGERLYRTGDLARYRPNGAIECLGRIDHQVKLRGFRIELGEIEFRLKELAGVRECAAALREDRPGDHRLVAYLVLRDGAEAADADLRAHLRRHLPEYMVPQDFVRLPTLPLTPNRKIDRNALPPVPDADLAVDRPVETASDPLERQLLHLWRSVLRQERIGLTDNFFEVGGHSLLAARLFSKMDRELGVRLPLAALFQAPTVEQLAAVIRGRGRRSGWSSLVPIRASGTRPPLFLVHGAGGNVLLYRDLADRLGAEQPVYGLQCRGLDGRTPHAGSFEAMAAEYLRDVRAVQPKGPYYLGGYCLGGAIALEMAQQLTAQGQPVALVAMIETYNLHAAPRLPVYYGLLHKLQNLIFHWENMEPLSWGEKRAFLGTKSRTEWERLKLRTAIACGGLARALHLPWEEGYPHLNVSRLNDAAHAAYAPRPYPGAITLFRPRCHYAGYDQADFGWGGVALGGVEVHELPVNPRGSLVPPFVDRLAQALTACLQSSQNARAAEPTAAIPWVPGAETHANPHDGYRWAGHH